MYTFRGNVAGKFGINAAVVAEYLYAGDSELEEMDFAGKTWYRCSAKRITVDNLFLTIDMIKHAVRVLRKSRIIRTRKLAKSSFDYTNWFCFTEYGENLMEGGEQND